MSVARRTSFHCFIAVIRTFIHALMKKVYEHLYNPRLQAIFSEDEVKDFLTLPFSERAKPAIILWPFVRVSRLARLHMIDPQSHPAPVEANGNASQPRTHNCVIHSPFTTASHSPVP